MEVSDDIWEWIATPHRATVTTIEIQGKPRRISQTKEKNGRRKLKINKIKHGILHENNVFHKKRIFNVNIEISDNERIK